MRVTSGFVVPRMFLEWVDGPPRVATLRNILLHIVLLAGRLRTKDFLNC